VKNIYAEKFHQSTRSKDQCDDKTAMNNQTIITYGHLLSINFAEKEHLFKK